jgi:hypothetical protein
MQRRELPESQRGNAEEVARRVLDALEPLQANGDHLPGAVEAKLAELDLPGNISTRGILPPLAAYDAQPVGTAFGISVGPGACVVGTVSAEGLTAEPEGSSPEYGCLEPRTH